MMNSTERPFSIHDPEKRTCSYCGDIFYSHHGSQRYCPDKFGKKDYCKYEQKKMLAEDKLSKTAVNWAIAGLPVYEKETPLDLNFRVIWEIMGSENEKIVSSDLLDSKGYIPSIYGVRTQIAGSEAFTVQVGHYNIQWVGQNGTHLTFKITKQ